ncbi:hypothetical protein BD414DRAFT_536654 [Trametes punicea]|nr:hypothetical protein BD414DRAFT_536654 [Trametes punicea]
MEGENFPKDHGVKEAIRGWARRFSRQVSPLTAGLDPEVASVLSVDDALYVTATPNTPSSIAFPDVCASPTPDAGGQERTPKSSISNQSDKTAVGTPQVSDGRTGETKEFEVMPNQTDTRWRDNVPIPLRPWFKWSLVIAMVFGIAGLATAYYSNQAHDGWDTVLVVGLAEATGYKHVLFTIPPILISMLLSSAWSWTDMEVRRLQPLLNLADRDHPEVPERTLLLDYTSPNVFVAFGLSMLRKDLLVMLASLLSIVTLAFQPLAGALFTVRDVWWIGPAISVDSLSKIGFNGAGSFMDMTSFQAASSFASADVIYNIGPPPFVSDGYTVAEFELPNGTIGMVYANRSAVLSQAACVAPDSLAMVNDQNTSVWHNTALFGQCEYTWTVNSNATYLFGVAPAAFAECGQDFADVPVQYQPVLFWFFMYSPQPIAAVVLCTPHASGIPVSVEIDLATKTTEVTPLQSSPDDANATNIGSFAYNGLFFDESNLDQTALARLQGIQQQLPGAVFEAAKAKDPLLMSTFASNGFTALAQDVYSTYLSLVAKSVYFVEDQESLLIRVGMSCKRIFLVWSAVLFLCVAMGALALGGAVLHIAHSSARRGLPLPPRLGTLSAAIWLTAQTDIALALADDDVTPERIAERLSGHRFFIHKESGRILRLSDGHKGRTSPVPKARRMKEWLLAPWGKEGGWLSRKTAPVPAPEVVGAV